MNQNDKTTAEKETAEKESMYIPSPETIKISETYLGVHKNKTFNHIHMAKMQIELIEQHEPKMDKDTKARARKTKRFLARVIEGREIYGNTVTRGAKPE